MLTWWRLRDLYVIGKKVLIWHINYLKCLFRLRLIRGIHPQYLVWLVFLDFWKSIEQRVLDLRGCRFGLALYLLAFKQFQLQLIIIRKITFKRKIYLLITRWGLISVNKSEIFLLGISIVFLLFAAAIMKWGLLIEQEWALPRLVRETEDPPLLHVLISIDYEEVVLLVNRDRWLLDLAWPLVVEVLWIVIFNLSIRSFPDLIP